MAAAMSSDVRSRVRLETEGDRRDQALADLPGLYAGTQWDAHGDPARFAYRYAAIGDGAMTLRTSRMRGSLRGDITESDAYVVQWLVSGHATVDVGRDDIELVPGAPLLFPADRTFVFDFHDYDQKLVHLERSVVARIATERGYIGPIRFDHRGSPSSAASALWFDTVGLVSRAVQRGEVNDLLWAELTRMTAAAFLELYPPVLTSAPEAMLHPGAARVREAVEHVHRFVGSPLTPADVAAAVGVSPRSLQAGFRQMLGTSPAAYIRDVRLGRAHEDLVAADPARATVGVVARRWGFAHLGRFSAQYRQRYGRYPSEDLLA